MTDQSPTKARRGCLFYGSIAATGCLVVVLLLLLLGFHLLKQMLYAWTDTQPWPLPRVEMTAAQLDQVRQRIDRFRDAARSGRPTVPLALSAEDINGLIATDPQLQAAKGKLFVNIEDSHLKAVVSLPLDRIGWSALKGRYLNGTGTLVAALHNGVLQVNFVSLAVKGKPLPSVYMDKLRTVNLAAQANDDPHASVALNRLEAVQVKDGKLILVPKEEH